MQQRMQEQIVCGSPSSSTIIDATSKNWKPFFLHYLSHMNLVHAIWPSRLPHLERSSTPSCPVHILVVLLARLIFLRICQLFPYYLLPALLVELWSPSEAHGSAPNPSSPVHWCPLPPASPETPSNLWDPGTASLPTPTQAATKTLGLATSASFSSSLASISSFSTPEVSTTVTSWRILSWISSGAPSVNCCGQVENTDQNTLSHLTVTLHTISHLPKRKRSTTLFTKFPKETRTEIETHPLAVDLASTSCEKSEFSQRADSSVGGVPVVHCPDVDHMDGGRG